MGTDKRLEILCEEFSGLEEGEKDYILEISQGLIESISAEISNAHKPNIYHNNLLYRNF